MPLIFEYEEIADKFYPVMPIELKFNLLGRAGIFDGFMVCFDDSEKKLYLYEKAQHQAL